MATAAAASFAELLKQYRAAAGLTQEELAERATLSARAISDLERGLKHRPYAHTVQRLMRALGLAEEDASGFQSAARRLGTVGEGGREPADRATPITNLPLPATAFIGRQREVAELRTLLGRDEVRLLTLTGTGGVGKTRLALQIAAGLVDQFPDGVWLVELASLVDARLVPKTVLAEVTAPEPSGRPVLDILREALRTRQLLLVLDNCEHLLDACAQLAEVLLRTCPRLRILATSREPLGLVGETRWRVPSLSLPTRDERASPAAVACCEAVQLFLERGRAVQPQFALTPANASAVAGVCTRLDGIPLALELAAARLSALGVADLYARLDQRFRLLTGGSSTALPRQQTLRATVAWSYDLLTPREQLFFARLSVFAGVWSLEGAEAVVAGGTIATEEVLDLLAGLVNKSLVVVEELDDDSTRYRLLETLRQYGWERLTVAGETALCQRRHAAYYLALAERFRRVITGAEQLQWLARLERDLDNLRAALAWCLDESAQAQGQDEAPPVEIALRLAVDLHAFWRDHDRRREGLAWLERALAHGAAAPVALRARALGSAGILAGSAHDLARAQALKAESIALCREIGDTWQLSWQLSGFAWAAAAGGQDEQAAAAVEEALALARAIGEPRLIAQALRHDLLRIVYGAAIERAEERARAWAAGEECIQLSQAIGETVQVAIAQLHLGQVALYDGDYERARALFVASLPMIRALGWRSTVAEGLAGLADMACAQGDYTQAAALYTEVLAIFRELGDQHLPACATVLARLTDVALAHGDWTVAQRYVAESLAIAQAAGQDGLPQLARALEAQAALAAVQRVPDRALRLAGAAAALRAGLDPSLAAPPHGAPAVVVHLALTQDRLNRALATPDRATLERSLAPARQALSADEQATAWAEGQAMTREQAITFALSGVPAEHGAPWHHSPERQRERIAASTNQRLSPTERLTWTLEHLRTVGPLSPREYMAALGVGRRTAVRDLRILEARGLLAAQGTTTDRRYALRRDGP